MSEGEKKGEAGITPKYPGTLSRELMEGGYTFLKRALKQALETGRPVIINSGRNYLQYEYSPGQRSFMDGVTVLDGDDAFALEAFRRVAEKYQVQQGVEELASER